MDSEEFASMINKVSEIVSKVKSQKPNLTNLAEQYKTNQKKIFLYKNQLTE